MEPIIERVKKGEVLVADGAMGSMLMARGLEAGSCPESFNLSNLGVLEEIASLYFKAGAEIIQTNTFGASPLKLSDYSLEERTEEINKNAVLAVKKVVDKQAYISASCGPSGRLLKPYGDVDPGELYNNFQRQLAAIIEAGVDIICVETMTDIGESLMAIKAARSISSSVPIMATLTFEKTKRGFYTIMGIDIERAVKDLEQMGVDIVGSNCGNGIENMILIASEFKTFTNLPILIQANAGIPELKGTVPVYPETPEFMANKARELVEIGVSIIGGCCGTTPEHIKALRKMVDSF
jgi:5-methyltetrahydrofolate--homocysteine methyltransferase